MFTGIRVLLAVMFSAALLAACGGGSSDSTPTPRIATDMIDAPITLNLYPNESSATVARITVMVTSVGSASVSMPAVFDTGSAGTTLYAPDIFPASMVTSNGFIFPDGQTSLSYGGITVTNQQGTRTYGTTNLRAQNGNIGFATLTFGDAHGTLTTSITPIFFYYSITDVTTGEIIDAAGSVQRGIFGVASTAGRVTVANSVEPSEGYPACATNTTGSCYTISPLKYLQYPSGVTPGFLLAPASIQTCDIDTAGSCAPEGILTIGLNSTLEAGFNSTSLPCPPNGYVGPASIGGYPVCQKIIDDVTLTVSGNSFGAITGGAVFDTGTANMQIAVPQGDTFPATISAGNVVSITTLSGFSYSYTSTVPDPYFTQVNSGFTGASVIGIGYFTTNFFYVDYSSGITGWK